MFKSLIITTILILFSFCSFAQDKNSPGQSEFEMAEDLFQAKKYKSWISLLVLAIAQNHLEATIRKGDAYKLGLGVEKNYTEALNWYKKAAEQHSFKALQNISQLYKDTLIENGSYSDAVTYFLSLDEKGVYSAIAFIGDAYLYGEGVEKNCQTALGWYQKGVEKSDLASIYGLGMYYLTIDNLDTKKALDYLDSACTRNYLIACETLGELYYKGEKIDADAEESTKWFTKGVELNGAKSHFYYASYILLGYVDGNKEGALKHAKKAKNLGYDKVACDWLILKINGEMK